MIAVTEATFPRRVLRSALPALVCFGARACPGRLAMGPALERTSAAHSGRLLVASALVDQAPLLAEQYGVVASPTLMVFAHGERQGQVVGFLPDGLLALLADDVLAGAVAGDSFWSPVEERFEEHVLIPLFQAWGLRVERQAACPLPGGNKAQRGRIDLLVHGAPGAPPLTLVESKRRIRGEDELQRAAQQARAYARSLGLASFIVAAPGGLWVYQAGAERARCVGRFSSLELHQAPERLRRLLFQLCPHPR
jgi:thioredoxin 1